MHIHTTEIEDCSQVITTLTSSNSSLKCLPPDWPKKLSNGSSNKPRHMLLGNKHKTFLSILSYRILHMISTYSDTHYCTHYLQIHTASTITKLNQQHQNVCKKSIFYGDFNWHNKMTENTVVNTQI